MNRILKRGFSGSVRGVVQADQVSALRERVSKSLDAGFEVREPQDNKLGLGVARDMRESGQSRRCQRRGRSCGCRRDGQSSSCCRGNLGLAALGRRRRRRPAAPVVDYDGGRRRGWARSWRLRRQRSRGGRTLPQNYQVFAWDRRSRLIRFPDFPGVSLPMITESKQSFVAVLHFPRPSTLNPQSSSMPTIAVENILHA